MFTRFYGPSMPLFRAEIKESIALDIGRKRCVIDGKPYKLLPGAWSAYIPAIKLKVIYGRNGNITCLSSKAPLNKDVLSPDAQYGNYTGEDWIRAYSTELKVRLCENYIASQLLADAGLGPSVSGVCIIKESYEEGGRITGPVYGYFVDNATKLPKKEEATEDDMLAAGTVPDKIKACVRQQINGYICDLNAVIGVVPMKKGERYSTLLRLLSSLEDLAQLSTDDN
jgi:hypothetical protein